MTHRGKARLGHSTRRIQARQRELDDNFFTGPKNGLGVGGGSRAEASLEEGNEETDSVVNTCSILGGDKGLPLIITGRWLHYQRATGQSYEQSRGPSQRTEGSFWKKKKR